MGPVEDVRAGRRCYLIYIVLDTSESMRNPDPASAPDGTDQSPLGHFTRLIPRMLHGLANEPGINSLAAVGVLAFNDRPEVLRPMSTLARSSRTRPPRDGHATDYAAVLRFMVAAHASDVTAVRNDMRRTHPGYDIEIARPWVFFITDGRPWANGAWQAERVWLTQQERLAGGNIRARIVSIGLPGADETVLWKLSTGDEAGLRNAFIAEPQTRPGQLAYSVIQAIEASISASTKSGQLTIDTPEGMRRIDRRRA